MSMLTIPKSPAALTLLDANQPENVSENPRQWAAYEKLRETLVAIEAEAREQVLRDLWAKVERWDRCGDNPDGSCVECGAMPTESCDPTEPHGSGLEFGFPGAGPFLRALLQPPASTGSEPT